MSQKGDDGERLIREFVDETFTSRFNFKMPRGKELADVIIWWSYDLFLIEIRTRTDSAKIADDWARDVIKEKVQQLDRQYERIASKERIFLHNEHYEGVQLNYEELNTFGIIVLVTDDELSIVPSEVVDGIYDRPYPISVFSSRDFLRLRQEVDTIFDLALYLSARHDFLRRGAVLPLDNEMESIGLYKMEDPPNSFPEPPIDFAKCKFWDQYRVSHAKRIAARNDENRFSEKFDALASLIPSIGRHLEDSIPIGLIFAWQLGGVVRRIRAQWGKHLDKVDKAFAEGKRTRKFAQYNKGTHQWIVFLFSDQEPREIRDYLRDLVETKWLIERYHRGEDIRILGIAFKRVNNGFPCEWVYSGNAFFPRSNERDEQRTQSFTQDDLRRAESYWQRPDSRTGQQVQEWPGSS